MSSQLSLDRLPSLNTLDPAGMRDLLRNFPEQIEDGIRIGQTFKPGAALRGKFEKIVFVGMGGSAIGGEVIRSLLSAELRLPIWIVRHYVLPPFVDSKALCIFSSYSGNTEETLAAFREGMKRKVKAVCITSGGELAQLSEKYSLPCLLIPKGLPPRQALGYSVFPILRMLATLKLFRWREDAVEEMLSLLRTQARQCGPDMNSGKNPAKALAEWLFGRFAVIYAGTDLLDSAALRFRNQIEENAKAMASHHLLPEMNHNEILGWRFPKEVIEKCACVFLKDSGDHERIKLRMKITRDVISESGAPIEEIVSSGKSRLARLFSVIYLGDWTSFYLALLYKIDPSPVAVIEFLKKQLAQVKFK